MERRGERGGEGRGRLEKKEAGGSNRWEMNRVLHSGLHHLGHKRGVKSVRLHRWTRCCECKRVERQLRPIICWASAWLRKHAVVSGSVRFKTTLRCSSHNAFTPSPSLPPLPPRRFPLTLWESNSVRGEKRVCGAKKQVRPSVTGTKQGAALKSL